MPMLSGTPDTGATSLTAFATAWSAVITASCFFCMLPSFWWIRRNTERLRTDSDIFPILSMTLFLIKSDQYPVLVVDPFRTALRTEFRSPLPIAVVILATVAASASEIPMVYVNGIIRYTDVVTRSLDSSCPST